ncbi:hypothetical protein [Lysobacter sp. cf310]|uniref:hypothetical protein n=1 Tax=Lysobacter sp. cf310 TaxID=1761790 RepID=UPI0008E884C5|nr:hypothetical protein [Lysobacter sp. cf310]SFL09550.1 hypothetical protein SAMN04487938_3200 [Lysobacter sp. cf310]
MRLSYLPAAVLSAALAACAGTPAPAEPGVAPDPAAPAERPAGKIGADQVGKVSPVPAFKGIGEHWSIDIQASGDMQHTVALTWGSGSYSAKGQARYNGQPADAPSSLIVLSGALDTAQGAKPMIIEIVRKDCTDDGDRPHQHSVSVRVEGMDPPLQGCGDLAVY